MSVLSPPSRQDLPCFTYGVFKEGELGFGRLEPLLAKPSEPAKVRGCLWVRDGLPLLDLRGDELVEGSLHFFDGPKTAEAYAGLCEAEPAEHYHWEQVELFTPRSVKANVLVGNKPQKGSVRSETGTWSARDDPVFEWGLKVVEEMAKADGEVVFESAPPDELDWSRFFRLQAAYLLLWSAIERFTALRFGPSLDPGKRVSLLGEDREFQVAVQTIVKRTDRVVDSRDPDDAYSLQPEKPATAITYYYRVRSNLSHRGKAAWKDGEIVRRALVELLPIFGSVLRSYGVHGDGRR